MSLKLECLFSVFLQLSVKEKLIFLYVGTEKAVPHTEKSPGRQLTMPGSQHKVSVVGVER